MEGDISGLSSGIDIDPSTLGIAGVLECDKVPSIAVPPFVVGPQVEPGFGAIVVGVLAAKALDVVVGLVANKDAVADVGLASEDEWTMLENKTKLGRELDLYARETLLRFCVKCS